MIHRQLRGGYPRLPIIPRGFQSGVPSLPIKMEYILLHIITLLFGSLYVITYLCNYLPLHRLAAAARKIIRRANNHPTAYKITCETINAKFS